MFFRKKIQTQFMITIPEPCSEDWEKMRVVDDEHRHCDSCARTLTDFTKMSDDELVLFFKYNNKKLCGRFSQNQINRSFTTLPVIKENTSRLRVLWLLPLTLIAKWSAAQQIDSVLEADTSNITLRDSISVDSLVTIDLPNDSTADKVDSLITEMPATSEEIVFSSQCGPHTLGFYVPEEVIYMGKVGVPDYLQASWRYTNFWDSGRTHPNKTNDTPMVVQETINDNLTENDPSEKKEEPQPPLKPVTPWYEAILPSSLRIRRKG